MKNLAVIRDSDFDLPDQDPDNFDSRRAARAVIIDDDGRILMIHVTKYDYYKCPGGGIQDSENIEFALAREMIEEAGCKGDIVSEIGTIQELRSKYGLKQISYLYLVRLTEIGQNNLEQDEQEDGFEVVWFENIDDAISTLEKVKQDEYSAMFMAKRELITLYEAKSVIEKMK